MTTCRICRFETELDDVAVPGGSGRCICLRCFARETGSERRLAKGLQHEVLALLTALDVA